MCEQRQECLVIHSVTDEGRRFRPSDWIERISANLASFGPDRRLRYNELVHPLVIGGEKCLFVSTDLLQQSPQQFDDIMAFAAANHLWIESAACQEAAA